MSHTSETLINPEVRKGQGKILRRFVPLLLVSTLAGVTYGVVWLTNPSGQEAGRGSWRAIGAIDSRVSPTGKAIVFSYQGALWQVGREGGTMTRLTKAPGFDAEPVWSPDEKTIAYFEVMKGELNLIDAQSGGPLKLPQKITGGGKLFFHPKGKKILGNFNRPETTSRSLAWLDVVTGTLEQVFDPPRAPRVFCVSDEGTQIAFAFDMDIAGEQTGVNGPQMDLFLVPALGGEPRKLTHFPSRIFDMSWSGNQLYFSSDVGGVHNNVWTLAIDRPERPRRLTSGLADEDRASLSADGRWMVYTDNRENATALAVRP